MSDGLSRLIGPRVGVAVGVAAAALWFYSLFPNTPYDKFTAKNLWCRDAGVVTDEPRVIDLENTYGADWERALDGKLDWTFESMSTGDVIKYGNLELRTTDLRDQDKSYGPNANDTADSMLSLRCNGYAKLDVYYDGKLLREGVSMVYAGKFIGAGGLFDGYPDFTLRDVLRMSGLKKKQVERLMRNEANIYSRNIERMEQIREDRQRKMGQAAYEKALRDNPEIGEQTERCNTEFAYKGDGRFEYTVRNGDNKVVITRRFEECDDEWNAFFPNSFGRLDTIHGTDVCLGGVNTGTKRSSAWGGNSCPNSSDRLHKGNTVTINAGRPRDMTAGYHHRGQR